MSRRSVASRERACSDRVTACEATPARTRGVVVLSVQEMLSHDVGLDAVEVEEVENVGGHGALPLG
jgi:hypothetical protein